MERLTCHGVGTILMDMTTTATEEILTKYNIKSNEATRATESQLPLFDEIINLPTTTLSSGGSCFNIATVLQSLSLQQIGFLGCLGDDFCGRKLLEFIKMTKIAAEIEVSDFPTGICAVITNGNDRSVISYFRGTDKLSLNFLAEKMERINESRLFFSTGFELLEIFEVFQHVVEHVIQFGKIFCYNIGAEYISKNETSAKKQKSIFPAVDFCFGNLNECKALIESFGVKAESREQIAQEIARLPKANFSRTRTVVITDGGNQITVCRDGVVHMFDPHWVNDSEIVNTNGAGDAFMAGFLYQVSCEGSLEDCVDVGCICASKVICMAEASFISI